MFKTIYVIFGITLILSLISCASTTTIQALNSKGEIDETVKIYVDGKHLGNGKAQHSDTNTVYSAVPFLELRKEGCKNHREKLDVKINLGTAMLGAIIAGAGIGIMSAGGDGKIDPETALTMGLPLGLAGIAVSFWAREYVPLQKMQFQCVKVDEE